MSLSPTIRRRLRCRGVVQGVGFRPAVYRLAVDHGLGGFVRNDADGVTIEVEGAARAVTDFEAQLQGALPPRARLVELTVEDAACDGHRDFVVADSAPGRRGRAIVPPDLALCANCRREFADPQDRRHRHPFATCTDCGPRYTIVRTLPYDRSRTSMASFPLCPACAREYAAPRDRRFHAEPICCPECGPRVWCSDAAGGNRFEGAAAIAQARWALAAGAIVALKGIGGFQLACRADDGDAVARLRLRKRRAGKPLAVMARDLPAAGRLAVLRAEDEALLASARGPIVLAPQRPDHGIAPAVTAGVLDLGVMLPTTPLHEALFDGADYDVLVMTSGNRSEEPICIDDDDARARLADIADVFLMHDRTIVRRVDDSVVRTMPDPAAPCVIRRSRGYAPAALALPVTAREPILALGGHLQVTACVAVDEAAHPSQHVGDLDNEAARAFLREVATGLEEFLAVTPRLVVADLHPDYASTWLADELARARGGRVLRVQHHLAHAAAVLAENGALPLEPGHREFALVLDGTGFGTDGTAWGAEWLELDGELRWRRLAHGTAMPLVGGEQAVREPWRIAVAALVNTGHDDWLCRLPLAAIVPAQHLRNVAEVCDHGRWPLATGAGRLFEAAGALLGLAAVNRFEGEAAMRLEALAAASTAARPWPEPVLDPDSRELPHTALLVAAAHRLLDGEAAAAVARGLLATYAALAVELTCRVLPPHCRRIALGGGCFANRLLTADLVLGLAARGVTTLRARELPPGDGGLAFGQAALAALASARGLEPRELPSPTTTAPE
ncbi:MAG: carbamoyltransferase HypF [Planctomycetes bacterium]|nr:carbamoyltransferase HypF [Planctomycetota bacterium]MCB9885928.1 carbamoyltransferase HypF [Planctomycetota bacterium]